MKEVDIMNCPKCSKKLMYVGSSNEVVIDEKYHETEHYICSCGFKTMRILAYKMKLVSDEWYEED